MHCQRPENIYISNHLLEYPFELKVRKSQKEIFVPSILQTIFRSFLEDLKTLQFTLDFSWPLKKETNWSTYKHFLCKSNGWNMFQKLWRKRVKGLLSVSFKWGCMTWRKKLNNSHVCWKCLLLLNQWGEKKCNKSFLFVIWNLYPFIFHKISL